MVNNHGDRKSPKDRVLGPLPNVLIYLVHNWGDPYHVSESWDVPDVPPSTLQYQLKVMNLVKL